MSAISKKLCSRHSPSDDVLERILVRLPVKSLKRFQGVNKSWAALISQPDFVQKHLSQIKKKTNRFQILMQTLISDFHFVHDPNNENFIKCFKPLPETRPLRSIDYKATLKYLKEDEAAPIAPRELDFLEINNPDSNPVIFGSVNGLICIEFDQTDIVIWNPSTKESKLLPQAAVIDDDLSIASVFYGFGYDDKTKDYKVVRGSFKGEYASNGVTWSRNIIVEVFSLKTGSWSTSQVINCMGSMDLGIDGQGCLVNETLHWVDLRDHVLRSFDLAEEKFRESVQDLSSIIMREDTYLGGALNIENCLAVYCLTYDRDSETNTKEYQIWVMKDIAVPESWTEVANLISEKYLKPVCISECGEVLAVLGKDVAWYSPKEKLFKNVIELDGTIVATKYIETLVSPLTGCVAGESGMASTVLEEEDVK